MKQVVITTIKIPKDLEQKILKAVVERGYGFHGKSKWISEAIEGLLGLPNMVELVDVASVMEINTPQKILSVRLPLETSKRIEDSVIRVRKEFPAMEGVKSNILRASIIQKLIRDADYGNRNTI